MKETLSKTTVYELEINPGWWPDEMSITAVPRIMEEKSGSYVDITIKTKVAGTVCSIDRCICAQDFTGTNFKRLLQTMVDDFHREFMKGIGNDNAG